MDLKRLRSVGEKLVAPLRVLALADLVLGAQFRYGPALEAFEHNPGLGFSIPLTSFQG